MGEAEVVGDLSVGGSSDPQEVMDGLRGPLYTPQGGATHSGSILPGTCRALMDGILHQLYGLSLISDKMSIIYLDVFISSFKIKSVFII